MRILIIVLLVAAMSSCATAQTSYATKTSVDSLKSQLTKLITALSVVKDSLARKENVMPYTLLNYTFFMKGDTLGVQGLRQVKQAERLALKVKNGAMVYQTDGTKGLWFMKESVWTFLK